MTLDGEIIGDATTKAGATWQPRGRVALQVRRLGRIAYDEALELQENLIEAKLQGEETDFLLLLEHEPVYTLGRGADVRDLQGAPQRLGVPVLRVSRGGGATFHGPGQLVAYPIVRLWPTGRDVHRYIRAIEAVIIAACASLGVEAMTKPSLTGVWVGTQKLASIGIGVRRGIAFHGLALNVSTDLAYFRAIVPCRMTALTMCNLSDLIVPPPRTEDVASALVAAFENVMGYTSVVVAS